MGQRQLLAALTALAAGASLLPAQGLVYRERWGYLHLEHRRLQLLQAMQTAAPGLRDELANLLLEPDQGVAFRPVARALARARGVPADDAFVLRATVGAFVLPEVADPEGKNEVCRSTNVSVFLPFAVTLPGVLAFDVVVTDHGGETVWSTRIEHNTALEDLRLGQASTKVPSSELADGVYQLTVRTCIDGGSPGPTDPVLVWTMHVLRGYQARSEAAVARANEVATALPELPRALLRGLAAQVARAYYGEAFAVASNGVVELQRLEQALRNVEHKKPVLSGMQGDVLTHLPTATETEGLACVLRLPARASGRPLVVFAAAAPCYDQSSNRPTAPLTRDPLWNAHELASFGAGRDWNVAFVESPGRGRNYAADLGRGLAALRELLGVSTQPVVLACDREAAVVLSYQIGAVQSQLVGVVLLGAGLQASTLDSLGALPLRLGSLRGHPGNEAVARSLAYVERKRGDGAWQGDVEALAGQAPAWLFGLPLFAVEIERFAVGVFAK